MDLFLLSSPHLLNNKLPFLLQLFPERPFRAIICGLRNDEMLSPFSLPVAIDMFATMFARFCGRQALVASIVAQLLAGTVKIVVTQGYGASDLLEYRSRQRELQESDEGGLAHDFAYS